MGIFFRPSEDVSTAKAAMEGRRICMNQKQTQKTPLDIFKPLSE
jgi:hypothetical protein